MNRINSLFDPDVSVHYRIIPENLGELTAIASIDDLLDVSSVKSDSRKAEILATRQLVRDIFSPDAVIGHNPDGSPFIENLKVNISISHCKGLVAIASHPHMKIGIDIERWRNTLLKVKPRFLSPKEIEHYTTPDELLWAWTAKEAVYKAAGLDGIDLANGISLPLDHTSDIATATCSGTEKRFRLFSHSSAGVTTTVAVPVNP